MYKPGIENNIVHYSPLSFLQNICNPLCDCIPSFLLHHHVIYYISLHVPEHNTERCAQATAYTTCRCMRCTTLIISRHRNIQVHITYTTMSNCTGCWFLHQHARVRVLPKWITSCVIRDQSQFSCCFSMNTFISDINKLCTVSALHKCKATRPCRGKSLQCVGNGDSANVSGPYEVATRFQSTAVWPVRTLWLW